jgi:hypothetical protein
MCFSRDEQMGALYTAMKFGRISKVMGKLLQAVCAQSSRDGMVARATSAQNATAHPFGKMVVEADLPVLYTGQCVSQSVLGSVVIKSHGI